MNIQVFKFHLLTIALMFCACAMTIVFGCLVLMAGIATGFFGGPVLANGSLNISLLLVLTGYVIKVLADNVIRRLNKAAGTGGAP